MQKPIIAVDIDDVLAQSTDALRLTVNERLGINLQPQHYQIPGDYWGYYEYVWAEQGIEDRISMDDIHELMKSHQLHVQPTPGAAIALKKLTNDYELIVITARDSNWQDVTMEWLSQHFPGIFSRVVFAAGHQGLNNKSKGEICIEEAAAWLIDDNVQHAQTAFENGVQVILFGDYGWHQNVPDMMLRCKDWQEVVDYFEARD